MDGPGPMQKTRNHYRYTAMNFVNNILYKRVNQVIGICAFIVLVTIIPWQTSSAQSNFQPGYIVTQSGDSLYGKIDDQDWIINPEAILFRPSDSSQSQTFTPKDLHSFGVDGKRYLSQLVSIDETPMTVNDYNIVHVTSITKAVFLSVLVRGRVSLFFYKDSRDHFYYSTSDATLELISHEYVTKSGGALYEVTNGKNEFRDQLAHLCPTQNAGNLGYNKRSLTNFVAACDAKNPSTSPTFVKKIGSTQFQLQLLLGLSSSSTINVATLNGYLMRLVNYRQNLAVGVSGEFISPGGREKRSIFTDLLFNSYSVGNTVDHKVLTVDYLKADAGMRYKFGAYRIRPFAEAGLSLAMPLHYKSVGIRPDAMSPGLILGLGVQLWRFGFDVRDDILGFASSNPKINSLLFDVRYSLMGS